MNDKAGQSRPPGWEDARWSDARPSSAAPAGAGAPPGGSALERFLGGPPLAVFVRLLVLSLVVGALLMWIDIRPGEIFRALERLIRHAWMMGFDAVRAVVDYAVAGAIVVVPIWFLLRLTTQRR
jgi:hypothetical protein